MRAGAGWAIAAVLLALGCGGGTRGPGDLAPEAVVIVPDWDTGHDPGPGDEDGSGRDLAADEGTAVPDDGGLPDAPADEGSPRDLAVDEGRDVPPDVPVDVLPDGPFDLPPDVVPDVPPLDPGPPDPGPVDAGHDLVEGACAPGAVTCWCVDETQCDPSYSKPCRPNRCNPSTGHCVLDSGFLEGQECEDGDFCTTGEICRKGSCVGGTATCECHVDGDCKDDGNPCTDDRCELGLCTHPFNAASCDDGDGCTQGDACGEGACVPGLRVCECDGDARCDDGVACTEDRCVEGSCTHALAADTCRIDGACVATGAADPGNACRACDPVVATDAWTAVPDGTACDDGYACTAPDACAAGACVAGPRVCECVDASECDDGNPCTDDTCDANACAHAANALPCEDGDEATLGDRCAAGACVPGPRCGDGTCARPDETCVTCPADCGGACPATETLCTDGWDDDLDGATDCADPDCQGLPPCTPDTCAKIDGDATCGMTKYWEMAYGNDLTGTTGPACGNDTLSGDETIWKFVSPVTRVVDVWTEYSDADGDPVSIYVFSGACNAITCIAADYGWVAEVTFTAEANRPYYIVSEEIWYANRFDIHVTCP